MEENTESRFLIVYRNKQKRREDLRNRQARSK